MALEDAGYFVPAQDVMAKCAPNIDSEGNFAKAPWDFHEVLSAITGKTIQVSFEQDISKLPGLLNQGKYVFIFLTDRASRDANPSKNLGNHVVVIARQASGSIQVLDPGQTVPAEWNAEWRDGKDLAPWFFDLPSPLGSRLFACPGHGDG
jgi:hypothetical protein